MIKGGKIKMWNEINSNEDLSNFLDMLHGFHDSCLKELKYISGSYVNENLSMYPINDQRTLNIVIQRQFKDPSVIELEFSGLIYLKMFPNDENYTSEIFDATMILKDDCIFWCDCGGLSEADLETYKGTTICASKVRWRAADEYIGQEKVYTRKKK
jgi:hypothetical protein